MNIAGLVSEARSDLLDDAVAPYLWSDVQLTRFVNEAVQEACLRAPLLERVKTLAITSDQADYKLDSSTRQILFAKLNLGSGSLIQTTESELSLNRGSNWRINTGTPTHYLRAGSKLRLYPIPTANDTLVISASHIPDDDFEFEDDIDPAYHKPLLYYIAYKAYLLNDQDAHNPIKAADYLKQFEAIFGIRHTAKYDAVALSTPMYGSMTRSRMC